MCGNDSLSMKKILPLIAVIGGLLLILIGGGVLYINQATGSPGAVPLPDSLAGLDITLKSEGGHALDEFRRLHRQDFPLVGGAVGSYGLSMDAKLWVAETLFEFMSERMTTAMRDKIAMVDSPFTPLGEFQAGDRTVYELEGMGQKHYYFQSGKLIIWLAADAEIAEQAIQETLEFYP